MMTPWSAEAFNDEGPAHMVFLDSYLIDKSEVSNKEYGEFMKATQDPAPAYWDGPRLNNRRNLSSESIGTMPKPIVSTEANDRSGAWK
jgi:formylglycine-generating enzyme required for sulfatase activity